MATDRAIDVFGPDDDRWAAVVRRDPAVDGAFYYSVRTTGVYCRPTCAARRARRENVRFHETWADAERAGFRPCKRCRPRAAPPAHQQAALVAKACRLIESAEDAPPLGALAAAVGLSPHHFHRLFTATTGLTPKAYGAAHRANRMREELANGATVTRAIHEAGYGSSGRFYEAARGVLGMSPRAFRGRGVGETIRFAVGDCSLGSVLVAASDAGVCAVLLGDDPDALVRDVQERFRNAALVAGDAEFEGWVAAVVGLVEAPRLGHALPLDVRGTAFQQRVWQALGDIPPGSTRTYADVAAAIGAPKAVRAVARACAANPIAVAIPCHRVVRRDGGPSGYRWGVERKRALLDREAAA
jgi:AraC family transcriptional regulator, regulatory protein of adaptative response / methylated-DNA-[protein]-cysteine methyltransferase